MKDFNGTEFAQTKTEWCAEQVRIENLEKDLIALNEFDQIERNKEIVQLDFEAVSSSINKILLNHPTEFETILFNERRLRGIEKDVESKTKVFLSELENKEYDTRS